MSWQSWMVLPVGVVFPEDFREPPKELKDEPTQRLLA